MALSPATGLANYSSGISSSVLTVDSNSDRVGIGTTQPQDTLQVGTAITMGSGTVTATQGNFQNVSIAGTLTYEDTTSVDSVGIITARSGISITGGGLSVVGDTDLVGNLIGVNATGISTINNASGTTLNITGVSTLGNTVVGGATTQLVVNGNARITGILTMGTSSITLDGTQDKIISGKYDFLGISTSHNDTDVVDVFVYDTTKDSDGGEWRKRTQHTSWYNEDLNTSTRGAKREFPSVAVIVTTSDGTNDSTSKVIIYDGDDPELPMWMEFQASGGVGPGSSRFAIPGVNNLRASTMLNGILCVAVQDTDSTGRAGLEVINFLSETTEHLSSALANGNIRGENSIAKRNTTIGFLDTDDGRAILNNPVYDVAMNVQPNAPIDDATGLAIPTIAMATDEGVSILHPKGYVTDITYGTKIVTQVAFNSKGNLNFFVSENSVMFVDVPVPSIDLEDGTAGTLVTESGAASAYYSGNSLSGNNQSALLIPDTGGRHGLITDDKLVVGSVQGITFFEDEFARGYGTNAVSYATTSYATGFMPGFICFATGDTVGTALTFTNLATDGDFGQSSDLTSWTAYNATLTHQTDAIRVADNGDYSKAYQSFSTIIGKKYVATVECKTLSGSDSIFTIGTALPATNSWQSELKQDSATGLKGIFFTATATNYYVELGSTGGGFAEYKNVRIAEVDSSGVHDRSEGEQPFEVFGTINRDAVATGSDLVAFSNFSSSNYLRRYPTTNTSQGNNDFSAIGWFKKSTSTNTGMMMYGYSEDNQQIFDVRIHTDMKLLAQVTDDNFSTRSMASGAGPTLNDNLWHQFHIVRRGNRIITFIDGERITQGSNVEANLSSPLGIAIGVESPQNTTQKAFEGSLALMRMSRDALSDEAIKRIYEKEKVLFQENAKCTIYGTSSNVTSVAYDSTTDQHYFGTSSGRSDFQGLRRINNTTVGITTSISAHDCLIIEE